jgi:Mn2+/Fe2+ NRAMP family transporter
MYYGILPALNPIMANAPTAAFLAAHLAYGLGVGVVMAWALYRRPGGVGALPARR